MNRRIRLACASPLAALLVVLVLSWMLGMALGTILMRLGAFR